MWLYEEVDISVGIDINKTSASKECTFCHCWHFGYKFEPHVCNKFHDVLMTAYELKNIAILIIKGVDCKCILWNISKNEAVSMVNNLV